MATSCALARQRLVEYVAGLRTAGLGEQASIAIKAGFVSSFVTPAKAIVGNAAWGLHGVLLRQPAEAVVDVLRSHLRSAAGGWQVKPHEFREFANALTADGLGVMATGFATGTAPVRGAWAAAFGQSAAPGSIGQRVARFIEETRTRLNAEPVVQSIEHERVTYGSPIAQAAIDGAFTVLEAVDRPWYRLAFDSSLYMQSRALAIREGLTREALRHRAAELMAAPTDEMTLRATMDARFATFKDRNVASDLASQVKGYLRRRAEEAPDAHATGLARALQVGRQRAGAVGSFIAETQVPFTGVPSSVAGKILGQTPLGLLQLVTDGSSVERTRTIAQVGVGGALLLAGYELADSDRITTSPSTDAGERQMDELAGRQAYSIRIGDTWADVRALGPAVIPVMMGVKLRELRADNPQAGTGEMAAKAAAFAGRMFTDQTYLQQTKRLMEATTDERKGAALLVGAIPRPALLGQVARATDPVRRDTRGLGDRLAAGVPFLQDHAPAQVNAFGDEARKSTAERVGAVFSPFPLRESTDTPLLQELRRLGIMLGDFGPKVTLGTGERATRAADDLRALNAAFGPELRRTLETIVRDPEYARVSDAEREDALRAAVQDYRRMVNDTDRERRGIGGPQATLADSLAGMASRAGRRARGQ